MYTHTPTHTYIYCTVAKLHALCSSSIDTHSPMHTHTHAQHAHLHFPCIFFSSLSLYSYNCIANIALSLSRCLPVCHPEWFRLLFACLQFPIDVNGRRCGRAGERESAECVPYVKCTINSRRARCPAQCMATLPRR